MNLSIMVKNYKGKVCNMYQDEYKRWLAADLEDADLKPELAKVEGNDDEIKDRFAVALKFGTAGLRGVLGAGTNRMNIYVVRQATQGLANWVKTQGGNQTVAISYDSRLKSDVFAKTAAGVLAANGIKVRIYDALMPVPALSFATRYYECNAGIMVTASHNPAKYNGYKAYGPDGCQMTDDAAAIVYAEIQKTDVLTGAKRIPFEEGLSSGMLQDVGEDCKEALYDAIKARSVRPGLCKTAGLKLVYSPLNGSGLVPVTRVLHDIGIDDITIVPVHHPQAKIMRSNQKVLANLLPKKNVMHQTIATPAMMSTISGKAYFTITPSLIDATPQATNISVKELLSLWVVCGQIYLDMVVASKNFFNTNPMIKAQLKTGNSNTG